MAAIRLIPSSGPPIEVSQNVLIGRDPACDVVLTDGSVSRRHARIEKRDTGWTVIDQASANGTFLDGQRTTESLLRQGQKLRFGALEYRIEIVSESTDSEATIVHPMPSTPPAPPPPVHAGGVRPPRSTPPGKPIMPPSRKSKSPLFWIAAGGCGCVTLVILLVAALVGWFIYGAHNAIQTVETQLTEIRNGDLASAYDHLSADYRSRLGPEEFEFFVESNPVLADNASISFRGRSRHNNKVRLDGTLTSASGQQAPIVIFLVKEGGTWRITDISLE